MRTLLLLVVFAALCLDVVVQQRRLAEQQAKLQMQAAVIEEMTQRIRGYNGLLAEKEFALRATATAGRAETAGQ
jgi:hypothetical protein